MNSILIRSQRKQSSVATLPALPEEHLRANSPDDIYYANTCAAGCPLPPRNKHGMRKGAAVLTSPSTESFDSGRTILTTYTAGPSIYTVNSLIAPTIATRDTIFSPTRAAHSPRCSEAEETWSEKGQGGYRLDSAPWVSLNETVAAERRAPNVSEVNGRRHPRTGLTIFSSKADGLCQWEGLSEHKAPWSRRDWKILLTLLLSTFRCGMSKLPARRNPSVSSLQIRSQNPHAKWNPSDKHQEPSV